MKKVAMGVVAAALIVAACSKKESPVPAQTAAPPSAEESARAFDIAGISRGARLFQQHCAECHGPQAQGHPDWQRPSSSAFVAAPPLNGTGNDWKRSKAQLVTVIRKGAMRKGARVMPAWKGRLSGEDIEDIITWFQALWPADVYASWRRANVDRQPKKGRKKSKG